MEKYPTVGDLAGAEEDDILKLWQGLGYYSRARNLHQTARIIAGSLKGKFPDSYAGLLRLKGIGEYTAAAIASISFNLPHAVVDGNVFRFLSRLFGISTPVNSPAGKREFSRLANELLDKENPGEYNQAVMEFGALCCTPKNPACNSCLFNARCIALKSGSIGLLPVKAGKTKVRARYFNYLLIHDRQHTWLNKRTGNDIWKNLYEFPLIETEEKTDSIGDQLAGLLGTEKISISKITSWKKQILSHQCIHYRFIYISDLSKNCKLPHLLKVNKKDILNFAVPKPIEKELNQVDW
jgi:A/G-specific adenine glycosylase